MIFKQKKFKRNVDGTRDPLPHHSWQMPSKIPTLLFEPFPKFQEYFTTRKLVAVEDHEGCLVCESKKAGMAFKAGGGGGTWLQRGRSSSCCQLLSPPPISHASFEKAHSTTWHYLIFQGSCARLLQRRIINVKNLIVYNQRDRWLHPENVETRVWRKKCTTQHQQPCI